MAVVVPFAREIREGMVGGDVVGHKRALSRWSNRIYAWPKDGAFTPLAGRFFMDAVVKYKKQHGLGTTPVLGVKTHESMEKAVCHYQHVGEPAFDAYAVKLCGDYYQQHHVTPEQRRRTAIHDAAFFWYSHRAAIAYSQYRPIALRKPPNVPTQWDCSGFVTSCYFAAGAPDPNGRGYDSLGYTGTLISHGTLVADRKHLKVGDLCFYGYSTGRPGFNVGDPTHVAVYVGVIDDVQMVLSMGHYPLSLYPVNYRGINQLRTYPVL